MNPINESNNIDNQFFIYDKLNKEFFPVPSSEQFYQKITINPKKRRLPIFESIAPSPSKTYSEIAKGL